MRRSEERCRATRSTQDIDRIRLDTEHITCDSVKSTTRRDSWPLRRTKGINMLERATIPSGVASILAIFAAAVAAAPHAAAKTRSMCCADLDKAAREPCLARVDCRAAQREIAAAARHYCICLAATARGASAPPDFAVQTLTPLMFGCCAGNAIAHQPNLCAKRFGVAP